MSIETGSVGGCMVVLLVIVAGCFALGVFAERWNRVPAAPVPCHCQKCEAKCCEVGK
jgi:hypothetical protein